VEASAGKLKAEIDRSAIEPSQNDKTKVPKLPAYCSGRDTDPLDLAKAGY